MKKMNKYGRFVLLAALTASCIAFQAAGYTAQDYVQSGLIAQWDGIENTGYGTHSDTATVWKDLAGNNDLHVVPKAASWGDKYLFCNDAIGCATNHAAISNYLTVEVYFQTKGTQNNKQCIFASGAQNRFLWHIMYNTKSLQFSQNHPSVLLTDNYADNYAAATYASTDATSPSATYLNGTLNNGTYDENWSKNPTVFTVGWGTSDSRTFKGRIYSIRLYSRALTAEEIAQNAAIDAARFAATDGNGNLVISAAEGETTSHTAAVGNVPKVIKAGGGLGIQSAGANGFAGTVDVQGGTLVAAHPSVFRNAAAYTSASGTTLDFARGCDGNITGAPSGSGTMRVSGTGVGTFTGSLSAFAGTWQLHAANVNFGTAATPAALNATASLDVANNGWFNFFGDQTVASLAGDGIDGGVDIASGRTLTLNSSDDTTFRGQIAGDGTFVKAGSGTLTLAGGASSVGSVEVQGGSLALKSRPAMKRTDSDLRCYWSFDNVDDVGEDATIYAATDLYEGIRGSGGIQSIADGVSGRAVHISQATRNGVFLRANPNTTMPSGNDPFTFSWWMRLKSGTKGDSYLMKRGGMKDDEVNGWATSAWGDCTFWYFVLRNKGKTLTFSVHGWNADMGAADRKAEANFESDLRDDTWHHVVGTYASRVLTLYLDGEQVAQKNLPKDMNVYSSYHLDVGNYTFNTVDTYLLNADYDEIQYCYGAWSATEVAAEYAARKPNVQVASLPAPVAHWTFDEIVEEDGVKLFKDSGPNGWDLRNVPTGSTYVECVTGDRINGGAAYLRVQNATLQLKSGVDPRTVISSTNPDFTLSVRIRNISIGDGTQMRPVLAFGNVQTAAKCFRLSYEGNPQRVRILPGSANSNEGWDLTDTYSTCNANAPWQTFTFVNKASEKKVYCYRDGKLIDTRSTDYTLQLDRIDLGYTPWANRYGYQVDDLQIFTNLLSAVQVKELVKEQAGIAAAPLAGVPVEVASGATLDVQAGGVQTVGALTGSGTVDVHAGGRFRSTDDSCFAGAIVGDGSIYLPAGEKSQLLASQVSTGVAFEDDTIVLTAAGANTPFIRTSGTVSLPAAGTLRLQGATSAGAWPGKRFLIAECAAYDGPADTTGWTFDPAATGGAELLGNFRFANGRLYLQMKGGSVTIIIR